MKSGTFRSSSQVPWFAVPRLTVLAVGLAVAGISTAGHAKVDIQGVVTDLRVTTSNDSISNVLAAIAAAVNMRYRTAIPLDTVISSTYSGSAERVIARLLRDYNFAIGHNGKVIEVSVFGMGPSATSTRRAPGSIIAPSPVNAPSPVSAPNPEADPALPAGLAPGFPAAPPRAFDSYERRRYSARPGPAGQPFSPATVPLAAPPPTPAPAHSPGALPAVTFSPVPTQAPAGTAPAFAPPTAYPASDFLGPATGSGVPAQDSAQSFNPTREATTSSDAGLVPAPPPHEISEPEAAAETLLSPAGQMAAFPPDSTRTLTIPPPPAKAVLLSPRRVQKSVSSSLPPTEFSRMFPESSHVGAVRVNRATRGPGQQHLPEQRAADTRVRQAPTSISESPTALERLVKTLSDGISKVLQP